MSADPESVAVNGKKEIGNERKERKPAENGKGVVKAVPAGDSLVVLEQGSKQGPPKEREIVITNIKAPRLGRRGGPADKRTDDEPFAFQSREYLRKKAIGKQVSFVVENKDPKSGKDYGHVFVLAAEKKPEDLSVSIVSDGWAEVRANSRDRPELEGLVKAEEAAKKDGKGIHQDASANVARRSAAANNSELYESFKGAATHAIVEQVLTGSTLRLLLVPSFQEVKLLLAGVESPDIRRDEENPAPFAREAKFFTEHYLLHRDVQVYIEAADQSNLYGAVVLSGHNIAEELLKAGLGKYVDWSGNKSAFADKLRAAERFAKEKKLRLYSNFVEPSKEKRVEEKGKPRVGKEFVAKVVDIQSIGTIAVVDAQGNETKINLSSIRPKFASSSVPPRQRAAGAEQEPRDAKTADQERAALFEAKEFLRRRLIGQRVRCVLDYTRASEPRDSTRGGKAPAAAAPPADRGFYTVYIDKSNVAVLLVEAGYAEAVFHRPGEPRAKDFEDILAAEAAAKKSKRKDADQSYLKVNDLSVDPAKSRAFLPSLKRNGRMRGVVEFEFSGARLKVYVPKENIQITLALGGVRTPRQGEPFSNESRKLARDTAHQHDIELEIYNQDKGGNFIGNVYVAKKSLATTLLEEGLAQINRLSVQESGLTTEYSIAEDSAKKSRKNLWKDYDEAVEEAKRLKRLEEREAQLKPKQELVDVIVTEIVDASTFYVQIVGPEAEQLEDLMKALSLQAEQGPHSPAVNEIVSAQFTEDDAWYRAKVTSVSGGEVGVFYVDYGNSETLPTARIRPLPQELPKVAHQAHPAQLAYIRPPKLADDFGPESAEYLKELVWGKTVVANVEYRVDETLFLSLGDRESGVHINGALVKAGLARVEKLRGKHLQPVLDKLREEEDVARKAHVNLWTYGDPGSDDDEL
eukprot:TRINITY_DN1108_c0_g1_i1.p1 TRINITY_DN1108_c0_g1~~TRINITY_DN1108_c0_g1_i1.p1  ORF type:complete len:918 (+),score=421.64 TRINITY_DN1108_c0_g1_i1:113-2866(+)